MKKTPQPTMLRYFRKKELIEHPKMPVRVVFVTLLTIAIVVLTAYNAFLLGAGISSYFTDVEGEEAAYSAIGMLFVMTVGLVLSGGQLGATVIHLILTMTMKYEDPVSHKTFRKICAGIRIATFFLILAGWVALFVIANTKY